jgi:hypothetical protein
VAEVAAAVNSRADRGGVFLGHISLGMDTANFVERVVGRIVGVLKDEFGRFKTD